MKFRRIKASHYRFYSKNYEGLVRLKNKIVFVKQLDKIQEGILYGGSNMADCFKLTLEDNFEYEELSSKEISSLKTVDKLFIPNYSDATLFPIGIYINESDYLLLRNNRGKYTFDSTGLITENTIFISGEDNFAYNLREIAHKDIRELGIGGLNNKFKNIFCNALASRMVTSEDAETYNINHTKGIILYGPPGTGKTLLAKKMGELLGCTDPVLRSATEFRNKYVGESERIIRELFDKPLSEPDKTHMIIIDEIDSIGSRDSEQHVGIINQLLTCVDGLESMNNIILIGMTNRLDKLDPALLRSGRFSFHIEISLPDEEARKEIFNIYLNPYIDRNQYKESIQELVENTNGKSGADVRAIVDQTISRLVSEKDIKEIMITNEELMHTIELTKRKPKLEHVKHIYEVFSEMPNVPDDRYYEVLDNNYLFGFDHDDIGIRKITKRVSDKDGILIIVNFDTHLIERIKDVVDVYHVWF